MADPGAGSDSDAERLDTENNPSESSAVRPRTPSIPVIDVVLDPTAKSRRADSTLHASTSPARLAVYGTLGGLLAMTALFSILIAADANRSKPFSIGIGPRESAEPAASTPVSPSSAAPGATNAPAASPAIPPSAPTPGPWRIQDSPSSPDVKFVEGTMDGKSFIEALNGGVPRAQVYRILAAFKGVRNFDKSKRHDSFIAMLDARTRRVKAFEYQAGLTDIYQAREQPDGTLSAEKLDLHLEKKR
ncbi:MAG TPA: hypothetical protein VJT73_15170, partial [Polyangiaceae bacterium]|nr:hypothetical protein [Polyangiaceae bacterium]